MHHLIRLATGRRLLLGILLFVPGSFALFRLGPYAAIEDMVGGKGLPEESVTSAESLLGFLTELGPEGRTLYSRFQLWDTFNPLLIALLGVLLVGWLLQRARIDSSGWRRLILVPLITPLADLVENGMILSAISSFPDGGPASSLLPFVTGLKFCGLMGTMLLVVVLLAVTLRNRRRA